MQGVVTALWGRRSWVECHLMLLPLLLLLALLQTLLELTQPLVLLLSVLPLVVARR